MTESEFRAALAQLGMTQKAFAAKAGQHYTTLCRQLADDRVPKWAEWIVTLLLERQELAERLAEPI